MLTAQPPLTQKKSKKKASDEISATINFDNEVYINNSNQNLFRVRYNLSVKIQHKVDIEIEYDFDFECDEEIDSSIPRSLLIRSEVPAYSYPYMKAYVENILTMSGFNGIPLPYINFLNDPMPDIKESQSEKEAESDN